jgi:hypothetical protein
MKKILQTVVLTIASFGFYACSLPVTTVRTIDDRPSLVIKGAQESSVLFVDGLNMGPARKYDGDPHALSVEPGTHTVSITENNKPVFEQRVFVESSQKTITIK